MSKTRSSIWYDDGAQRVAAVLPDGRHVSMFLCAECGSIYLVEGSAKECCHKVGPCATCGQPAQSTYRKFCEDCSEQQAIEAWQQLQQEPVGDLLFWDDDHGDVDTFLDRAADALHEQGLEPSGTARVQQCIELMESLRPVNGKPFHLEPCRLPAVLFDGLGPEDADDEWVPAQLASLVDAAETLIDAAAKQWPLYQVPGETRPAGIVDKLLDCLGEE